jgi:hypothetical protein
MKKISQTDQHAATLEAPASEFNKSTMDAWEKLSALAKHWQSDIKFYQDEIRFLHNLIVKYFMWLSEEENLSKTKQIARELASLEIQRRVCEKAINTHLQHFGELVENPFSHDSHQFNEEHFKLENELADFVKSFRRIKRNTFELTEHVIESEKVKHLLNNTK